MNLINLAEVRNEMLNELNKDIAENKVYLSTYISENNKNKYIDLLRNAIVNGNIDSFQQKITPLFMNISKSSNRQKPSDAESKLAEGEFNKYYIRGICIKAINENKQIEIYRARQSLSPRQLSQSLIGSSPDPQLILNDLRQNKLIEPTLGVPGGPNSGISIKIKEN